MLQTRCVAGPPFSILVTQGAPAHGPLRPSADRFEDGVPAHCAAIGFGHGRRRDTLPGRRALVVEGGRDGAGRACKGMPRHSAG